MAQIYLPPLPNRRAGPLGHNAEEAIIITSSDEEDNIPVVPRGPNPRPTIAEQRARLRNNRNGTPIVDDRLRIMSPPPPVPQLPHFMLHEPGPIHERRRNPLMGTLPLAPGAQDGMMPNLHGFLRAERLQLLNLLQHPRYADFGSFMDFVGLRDRQPAGPPAPPPEYDVRMTHASAKPRIGYTFDFEMEPEAPVEPAVRTRTTIIIPDSPPARPVDYKGKGKAKEEDLDEIDLNGPDAPIELVSSPAAGSSSSSRPKKKQQQRRAVEIVEFLSDDESDDGTTGSPSNSQPAAHKGLQNVLVCASCRRPLRTGGDRLWALRCGHMIDSRCYHRFSEQPLDEQGPSTFDLAPSTSTAPPRPQRPSKRRKTERKAASKPTTPQVVQTYQWKCPASGCGRVHTSERVVANDETSWRPAQADGAIKVSREVAALGTAAPIARVESPRGQRRNANCRSGSTDPTISTSILGRSDAWQVVQRPWGWSALASDLRLFRPRPRLEMILLPGHHSRRRERQGTEDMDRVTIAGLPGQGVGLGDGITPTTPANEKTVDPASVAAGPSEFDEYGAELGPEARVWKTYVREADKFDMELVEEWNKSLDVILIFAALFSAISSTFVMDSTRKLQQDPSDTSAQTLTIISQTLMAMANNNTPPSGLATPPSDDNFSPRRAIVMVNILWFLSLSLSVAVSLIAMLAKEWCHAFMAGRTGHPCAQARRRQRRWKGLTQWRMPEVLVILPSLTHLALLLFAVGLCIYLWDIHSGVAVPVIVVTVCASGIYMASTILPLVYEHCPYSTTISRLAQQFYDIVFPKKGSEEDDYIKQDRTTSEALGWLIESCEDPRSVDIALQAIAGADKELPLDALRQSNASVAVSRRLTAGSAYPKNYATVFSLYARALAVLQPSTGRAGDGEQYDHVNELKRKIRVLQTATERDVAHLLSTEPFFPKQVNLWALRIGSTAPSLCLRSLNYVEQDIMFEALKAGIDLLEKVDGAHRSRQKKMSMILPGTFKAMRTHRIHPASLQSLVKGLTTLLSCSLIHSDISTVAPHVVRLLHIEEHREHCRIFLAVLAISRNDYPGWTHPAPLDAAARAERAIELLAHYELTPDPIPARTLMVLGLFELLLCSRDYGLVDRDFTRIYELLRAERWADGTQVSYNDQFIHALPPVTRNNPQTIHTFPASFDLDQYHLNALTEKLSNTEQRSSILSSVASTEAHLGALCFICNQSLGTFPPQIYVFILEAVCLASSDLAQSMAMDLMIRFPPPELTEDLAQILVNRNTFEMLARALDSGNPSVEAFATTQIRMLMQLVLQSSQKLSDGAILVLSKLCQRDDLCHPLQRLEMIKQGLRGQFTLVDRAVRRPDILPPWIELYLRRRGAEHS